MTIAVIVSTIGIVGGILLGLIGLFLLWSTGLGEGGPLSGITGVLLVAMGITGVLIWVFIGSFAQTIAAGVRVIAAQARDS